MTIRCPAWSDERDADEAVAAAMERRRAAALGAVLAGEGPDFASGATAALRHWHRELFAGTTPLDAYAGGVRGDAGVPCLMRNVKVEGRLCTHWGDMDAALRDFDAGARERLAAADEARQRGDAGWATVALGAAAWVMAEVLRIHPFLNGNGRVARLALHAILRRYGMRAEGIEVSPAPGPIWSELARRAVRGDVRPLRNFLMDQLGMYPHGEEAA